MQKCLVPLKVRKTLKPPLDAAKGQKLEYIIHQWKENDSFRDLIGGLLWLSLRPETVTIKLPQGAPRKLEVRNLKLKFYLINQAYLFFFIKK